MTGSIQNDNKLAAAREYERQHLSEMADTAQSERDIIREIYTPKSERIKKYAQSLGERVDLKDPMLDITEKKLISSYIARKYREHGVSQGAIDYVREVLTDEYKNKAYEREQVDLGTGLIMESGGENPADLKKPVKQMDRSELHDTDDMIQEKKSKLKAELARLNDIQEDVYAAASEMHFAVPSMKSATIGTPKPEAGDSEFSTALIDIANLYQEVARKVIEFPPSPQDASRYAKAARTHIQILTPFTDLKYTKGPKGWLKTILDFDAWGKHAAAVKNAVQTPSGVNRPLTREQVGDKVEEVLQGAIDMIESDHLLKSLSEHHERYIEPHVAQRKVNLHDTLSEKA